MSMHLAQKQNSIDSSLPDFLRDIYGFFPNSLTFNPELFHGLSGNERVPRIRVGQTPDDPARPFSDKEPLARQPEAANDAFDLKALSFWIAKLDGIRRRYGSELAPEHGKSKRSRSRRNAIKQKIDNELAALGGPYRLRYVRAVAIQFIDPHHNWDSGITIDPKEPRVTFSDAMLRLDDYIGRYGSDPYMTLAFALLVEAAREVRRLGVDFPALRAKPYRLNSAVMNLIAKFGFSTNDLAKAASLLITTPAEPKPKRKTETLKKPKMLPRQRGNRIRGIDQ